MAEATAAAPVVRPLVPYLTLGETREEDYLNGSVCKSCGTKYVGPRLFCAKCSSDGPFETVRLASTGEVHVFTVIHQATPYVKAPYLAAVVDLDGELGGYLPARVTVVPGALRFIAPVPAK